MNINDFARQMTLKYRVALAISIIKSKPENLLLEHYINLLKEKNDTSMDSDTDVTVCSDDFLMDDAYVASQNGGKEDGAKNYGGKEYGGKEDGAKDNKDNQNGGDDHDLSANLLEGFDLDEFVHEVGDSVAGNTFNDLDEAIELPKEVYDYNFTQTTFCESQNQKQSIEYEVLEDTQTFYESNPVNYQQNTSKVNIIDDNSENSNNTDNLNKAVQPKDCKQNQQDVDTQKTLIYTLNDFTHVSESQTNFCSLKNNHLYNIQNISKDSTNKIEKTTLENCKNVNQIDNVEDNQVNITVNFKEVNKPKQYFDTNHKLNNTQPHNKTHKEIIAKPFLSQPCFNVIPKIAINNKNTANETKNFTKLSSNAYTPKTNQNVETLKIYNEEETNNNNSIPTKDNLSNETSTHILNTNLNDNEIEMDLDVDIEDSQAELIPFKVIEELSRIKNYLNKRVLETTDSGYKTDSQTRSSQKGSFNTSDTWINQSAHCLLTFITNCPVILRTREITNEISRTLGRLIDRLHEEEKYPTFLENVLGTVEKLLKDIYNGDSYVEDVILCKDDDIHRLLSLNRSHHIIKYTIDKITHLLEDFYPRITDDCSLEITNTTQVENLCYILYILEHLLKRYALTKDILSQSSSQTTQEDERSLKRSSITDLWRRKWNPQYKLESQQATREVCSENRCIEVLKKIIVKAMDGYSLIAFAALQCFNLFHS